MMVFEIHENELRDITLFLIKEKIIFHPIISPIGVPDFTNYYGREYVLILDRNILVRLIRFIENGELKEEYSRKLISALMLWCNVNNIKITSGIALSEYAHHKAGNVEANIENSQFLEVFDQYAPKIWLDIYFGRQLILPIIEIKKNNEFEFFYESNHYKMHYIEMLKLAQLFYEGSLDIENKFSKFHTWTYENILVCKYTTCLAALIFGGESKIFNKNEGSLDAVLKKCKNQAWDLNYLSFWSTYYYYENNHGEIYLFSTLDKELKKLFMITHKETGNHYIKLFGNEVGSKVISIINEIYQVEKPRIMPEICMVELDKIISIEETVLKNLLVKI